MPRFDIRSLVAVLCFIFSGLLFSQPAGISGTDFVFWLQADVGVTDDGSGPPPLLTSWADQSGNALNASPGSAPEYLSLFAGLNNQPAIYFSNGTFDLLVGKVHL